MRARLTVLVLVLAVVFYVGTLLVMALAFLAAGGVATVLGFGILAVLVVSLVAVARELRFGVESTRLARLITEGDGVPLDTVQRDADGRIDPAAAELEWQRRRALVDGAPDDWRAWFLLGIAYDNARDRKQARNAIRRAIALEKAARRA